MRRFLAASLVLSAVAAANAQLAPLSLWFSNSADGSGITTGNQDSRHHYSRGVGASAAIMSPGPGSPTVNPDLGEYLYLWASLPDGPDTKVQGLNLNFVIDGPATFTSWQLYGVRRDATNPTEDPIGTTPVARYRWEASSVRLGQGVLGAGGTRIDNSTLTAVQTNGLQSNGNTIGEGTTNDPDSLNLWDEDAGVTTWLLGIFRVAGGSRSDPARVWIELGANGAAYAGGAGLQPPVEIGGDAGIAGGVGAAGRRSANPDALVVPEPASLILLGLAALALRRR